MQITILKSKNYLEFIRNAARGSNHMFRNLYANVDGVKRDILEGGRLSCAFFVSSMIYMQNCAWPTKLVKEIHTTVSGLENDLQKSGWRELKKPKSGAVLIWEKQKFNDGSFHRHVGFYVGGKVAISNHTGKRFPVEHHYTFGVMKDGTPVRKIEKILWHDILDSE